MNRLFAGFPLHGQRLIKVHLGGVNQSKCESGHGQKNNYAILAPPPEIQQYGDDTAVSSDE